MPLWLFAWLILMFEMYVCVRVNNLRFVSEIESCEGVVVDYVFVFEYIMCVLVRKVFVG